MVRGASHRQLAKATTPSSRISRGGLVVVVVAGGASPCLCLETHDVLLGAWCEKFLFCCCCCVDFVCGDRKATKSLSSASRETSLIRRTQKQRAKNTRQGPHTAHRPLPVTSSCCCDCVKLGGAPRAERQALWLCLCRVTDCRVPQMSLSVGQPGSLSSPVTGVCVGESERARAFIAWARPCLPVMQTIYLLTRPLDPPPPQHALIS